MTPNHYHFEISGDGFQPLGDLSYNILDVIWEMGKAATVKDVQLQLAMRGKEREYTTVLTTLNRLHTAGWVARERIPAKRADGYRPVFGKEDFAVYVVGQSFKAMAERFPEAVNVIVGVYAADLVTKE